MLSTIPALLSLDHAANLMFVLFEKIFLEIYFDLDIFFKYYSTQYALFQMKNISRFNHASNLKPKNKQLKEPFKNLLVC